MDGKNEGTMKIKKNSLTKVRLDTAAYVRQKEKAYQRKRKYLQSLTEEQKELKRAKDREYYRKKVAGSKRKSIQDMTETEKGKQRVMWKENSKKYRQKKKSQRKTPYDTSIKNNDKDNPHSNESSTATTESKSVEVARSNESDTSTAGPSNVKPTSMAIKPTVEATESSVDQVRLIDIKIEPLEDDIDIKTEEDPLSSHEYVVPVKNEFDESIMVEESRVTEVDISNIKKET